MLHSRTGKHLIAEGVMATSDRYTEEIERLEGQICMARWSIALLFEFVFVLMNDETKDIVIQKIRDATIDSDSDFIREGTEHFKIRLLETLLKNPNDQPMK